MSRRAESGRAKLIVGGTIAGVVIALLAAEAGLRLTAGSRPELAARLAAAQAPVVSGSGSFYAEHPFLPIIGKPGLEYWFSVASPDTSGPLKVTQNAYGFRSHDFPDAKDKDDYFIVTHGGSTTWGAIAGSNETTWPGLLEARLRERYPDRNVRVFNLGISSATSAYSVVALSLIGIHLNPDLIIVYHGKNDIGPMMRENFRTDHAHHFVDFRPADARAGLKPWIPSLLLRSAAIAYLASVIDRTTGANDLNIQVTLPQTGGIIGAEDSVGRLTSNLRTMKAVAAGVGSEILFSTFQFYEPDDITTTVNDGLRSYFEANNLAFVDQEQLIPDGDRAINVDECHFTRKGREMVAENFFDFIVEEGYVER